MKTVYLVRHAKAEQYGLFKSDFDRPLNERGKNDAPAMAKRLLNMHCSIELFISSPAKRAISTCRYFCKEFDMPVEKIIEIPELYHASPETILQVISEISDSYDRIALFAHNPGITELANRLVHGLSIDNMPTCAVLCVNSKIDHWKEFMTAEKVFSFFEYPKKQGSQ